MLTVVDRQRRKRGRSICKLHLTTLCSTILRSRGALWFYRAGDGVTLSRRCNCNCNCYCICHCHANSDREAASPRIWECGEPTIRGWRLEVSPNSPRWLAWGNGQWRIDDGGGAGSGVSPRKLSTRRLSTYTKCWPRSDASVAPLICKRLFLRSGGDSAVCCYTIILVLHCRPMQVLPECGEWSGVIVSFFSGTTTIS